ncbi:MAG: CbtB-domain containing protein [Methylococcaceae bacterium]|nr:CbtB-domain containing protein [Methylococcaceae bacterium]
MKTLIAANTLTTAKILPGLAAIILGLTIVLGLGFLQDTNNYVHNAAHDGRHNTGFPCH